MKMIAKFVVNIDGTKEHLEAERIATSDWFIPVKSMPRLMYLFDKLPGSICDVFYPPNYELHREIIKSCEIKHGGIEFNTETEISKRIYEILNMDNVE